MDDDDLLNDLMVATGLTPASQPTVVVELTAHIPTTEPAASKQVDGDFSDLRYGEDVPNIQSYWNMFAKKLVPAKGYDALHSSKTNEDYELCVLPWSRPHICNVPLEVKRDATGKYVTFQDKRFIKANVDMFKTKFAAHFSVCSANKTFPIDLFSFMEKNNFITKADGMLVARTEVLKTVKELIKNDASCLQQAVVSAPPQVLSLPDDLPPIVAPTQSLSLHQNDQIVEPVHNTTQKKKRKNFLDDDESTHQYEYVPYNTVVVRQPDASGTVASGTEPAVASGTEPAASTGLYSFINKLGNGITLKRLLTKDGVEEYAREMEVLEAFTKDDMEMVLVMKNNKKYLCMGEVLKLVPSKVARRYELDQNDSE